MTQPVDNPVDNRSAGYVCPQCGPDPAGDDEHTRTHHTWAPSGESDWQPVVNCATCKDGGHVLVSLAECEQLTAVAEAARALVASEAARDDPSIDDSDWLAGNRQAMTALTAAVNALGADDRWDEDTLAGAKRRAKTRSDALAEMDAPEATDAG
jgi:hypothetical protein